MSSSTTRPVEWSPRAIADLEGIHAYIARFAPLASERFATRLVSAVESLAIQPDRGRPVGRYRELVAISPYVVRYRVTAETVQIMRIRHSARRKG